MGFYFATGQVYGAGLLVETEYLRVIPPDREG